MSFRKEKKFRLTVSDYYKFQNELFKQGMTELFKPRTINSIYYDTPDLRMFHDSEEGVLPRKKVRIRWYNNQKNYFLEKKISSIEGRFKTTTKLKNINIKEQLNKNIFDKDYGMLRPKITISYKRSYFNFREARITFDENITVENVTYGSKHICFENERVAEIKVPNNCSEDFIQKIIPYASSRFSKYSRSQLLLHNF